MRLLTLISVLMALPLSLGATRPSSRPSAPPPGAIQLPEGFLHEQGHTADSTIGRIWKLGALEIKYDIGHMAGNHSAIEEVDRLWAISQVINGQPVEIVRSKDGLLIATFTKNMANFWAKVSSEQDVASFLTIVLTYQAEQAAE